MLDANIENQFLQSNFKEILSKFYTYKFVRFLEIKMWKKQRWEQG